MTDWGEVGSASAIDIVALRLPVASGVKVIVIVQLVPPAIEAAQVFVCTKSDVLVPVSEMEVTATAAAPRLVTVTVFDVLELPTFVEGKLTVFEDTLMAYPVPDRVTSCGELGSESLICRVAVREYAAWGVKCTVTIQLVPPEIQFPQVFV